MSFSRKTSLLVNSLLHHLDFWCYARLLERPILYPPIIIVGAPRSGSTLLYQVLTTYYRVSYISNFHAKFYGSPAIVEQISRLLNPVDFTSNFTSYYGKTQGKNSPSECGEFWYRFFCRKPPYVPIEDSDPQSLNRLRASIHAFTNISNKTVILKNLYCSLRLQPIAAAIPECLFIVIRRNPVKQGHSILTARKKVNGDYHAWWSVEPPAIDKLKLLPPHQQVVEQIFDVYQLIDSDQKKIGPDRFLHLSYEDFCRDTRSTLQRVDEFFKLHKLNINSRVDISKIPTSFQMNNTISIDRKIYFEMKDYIETKF